MPGHRDSFRIILERQDGFELSKYCTEYESTCDFLSGAADSFGCSLSCDISDRAEFERLRESTYPLQRFVFLVNGQVQLRGQLDDQTIDDDGTIHIIGSDYLANAADSNVGRNLNLAAGDRVDSCIVRLMQSQQTTKATNGWNAVRNHMAGVTLFDGAPLVDFGAKVLGEKRDIDPKDGIWENCNSIAEAHSFLGKAGINYGDFHMVAPEYRQEPAYSFTRSPWGGVVNFSGTVKRNTERFPTVFLAYGQTGKATEPTAATTLQLDPFVDMFGESPDVQRFAGRFLTLNDGAEQQQAYRDGPNIFRGRYPYRPGHTIGNVIYREMRMEVSRKRARNYAELQAVARRNLSTMVKDSLVVHGEYKYGHSIKGVNITPDTIAKFTDDIGGIYENLWLASRTFRYQGGEQTTAFEAYRPASIVL